MLVEEVTIAITYTVTSIMHYHTAKQEQMTHGQAMISICLQINEKKSSLKQMK